MTYARAYYYESEQIPILPKHSNCENTVPTKYIGAMHVYAMCVVCRAKWILLANESWEALRKDTLWIGPASHGEHE